MKKRFLCLSLVFALAAAQAMPISAARKDEVQVQNSEAQSKFSQAEANVDALEGQKNALMGEISSTQQQLVSVMAQVDMLEEQIQEKESDITKTQEELKTAEAERDEQYEAMKKRIQYMYENSTNGSWAQQLLESDSIASMLTTAENTEKMYSYDREELNKLKESVQLVEDLEAKLEGEMAQLESTKQAQEEMQQSLETKVNDLKATASDFEAQIASARQQAEQYKALIEQQNEQIRQMQEQEDNADTSSEKEESVTVPEQEANTEETVTAEPEAPAQEEPAAPEPTPTPTPTPTPEPEPAPPVQEDPVEEETPVQKPSNSALGQQIVAYAEQFIGNPYVYGGNSLTNGIDCSGFTQQIFAHFGYSLPRVSDAQAYCGVEVSWSQHQAGDIIVYPGHVAILTGDGGIVHASNSAPYPQGGIKYTANALYTDYITIRRII